VFRADRDPKLGTSLTVGPSLDAKVLDEAVVLAHDTWMSVVSSSIESISSSRHTTSAVF